MMKRKQTISKIIACLMICTLTAAVFGCGSSGRSGGDTGSGDGAQTKEYRFAGYYNWFLGQEEYRSAIEFYEEGDDTIQISDQFASKAYRDGDYLILEATGQQRDALIEQNHTILDQAIEQICQRDDTARVEYAQDWTSVTFYLSIESFAEAFSADSLSLMGDMLGMASIVLSNQVLTTGDCNTAIDLEVINSESGYRAARAVFPYESLNITDKDWAASTTADVTQPSSTEGYSYVPAVVTEANDQKIIFEPEEESAMYRDDKQLCLCLDSNYADDVHLPYGLEAGERVHLLLDGQYAVHEDGDDIPDIWPLALIPDKYFK